MKRKLIKLTAGAITAFTAFTVATIPGGFTNLWRLRYRNGRLILQQRNRRAMCNTHVSDLTRAKSSQLAQLLGNGALTQVQLDKLNASYVLPSEKPSIATALGLKPSYGIYTPPAVN